MLKSILVFVFVMHAFYTLRWGKIAQESKLSRSLPVKNAKVCCFWVSDLPINTNKRFMLAKVSHPQVLQSSVNC